MKLRTIATFAAGPVGSAVLGFAIVPLTAWSFSPEDIGRLNVLQTITPLVVTGVFLGLDQAYVREFHEARNRRALQMRVLRVALIVFTVLAIPLAIAPTWTATALYGIASPWPAWMTLLSVLLAILIRQWMLVSRMSERSVVFALSQLAPKVVVAAALGGVLWVRAVPDFSMLLGIYVAGSLAAIIVLMIAMRREISWARGDRDARDPMKPMLRYAMPLALGAFVYVALNSVNTLALRLFSGFEELGVFAIAFSIAAAAGVVQQVFSIIWSPIVYRALSEGAEDGAVVQMTRVVTAMFGVTLALAGSLSWVIDLFLGPQYAEVKFLVVGLVFATLTYMVREVTGVGILITRKTGFTVIGNVLALAIMVALASLLTPHWGAAGAVASAVVTFWFVFTFNTEVSARIWRRYPSLEQHLLISTGALLSLATLWIGAEGESWYVFLWVGFGAVAVARGGRDVWRVCQARRVSR